MRAVFAPQSTGAYRVRRPAELVVATLLFGTLAALTATMLAVPTAWAAPMPAQQAYLKASNTGADDNFGASVAVSGNTLVVGAISEDSGATGMLASAWLIAQPFVSTVIAGARTIAQLEENIGSHQWRLTSEDLAAIDAICPPPAPQGPLFPQPRRASEPSG